MPLSAHYLTHEHLSLARAATKISVVSRAKQVLRIAKGRKED